MAISNLSAPYNRRSMVKLASAIGIATSVGTPLHATTASSRRPSQPGMRVRLGEHFVPGVDPARLGPPPANTMVERYLDVPDGRLKFLDTGGTGEAVVLIHATTGTARAWDYQVPVLQKAGYRVIAYWRRGTLASLQGAAPDNMIETADLLAIAQGLGLSRFHLVGTASGAFIAIRFAVAYAERLLSLTLSNSLLGLSEPSYTRVIDSLLPDSFQALPSSFKELSASYRVANPLGVQRWLAMEAESFAAKLAANTDMAARMRAGTRGTGGPNFVSLGNLTTPVQLISGDADLYAPPALARIVAPRFRAANLTIIGECAHAAHWEQPASFNAVLLAFLLANSKRRGS